MLITLKRFLPSKTGFIWAFFLISKLGFCQDIYDKVHSLKYCRTLFVNKKFESAFAEFERIKFYKYDNDSIYARAMFAYSKLIERDKLKTIYSEANNKYPTSTIIKSSYFISNPEQKKLSALLHELELDSLLTDSEKTETHLKMLISNNEWNACMDYMIGNKYLSNEQKQAFIPIISKGSFTKLKSPVLGAAFSAILPGSGKLYAGEKADGIISMVTVSVLIAGAIRSYFIAPENPWTYVLGGLSIGFYSGNIFGSYHSVKKTNKQKQQILNEDTYKVFTNF